MSYAAAGPLRSSLLLVEHRGPNLPSAIRTHPVFLIAQAQRVFAASSGPSGRLGISALAMMSDKHVIQTDEAPAPVGAYSQDSSLVAEDAAGQAKQALENMGAILRAAGASFRQVVKTTILLADIADFKAVNEVYGTFFTEDPPARVCYAVKTLPLNAKVEIDAIAVGNSD